jgi:hypothetical protein
VSCPRQDRPQFAAHQSGAEDANVHIQTLRARQILLRNSGAGEDVSVLGI